MAKKDSKRGFAGMSTARHKEICVMGGQAVPAEKRVFSQFPAFAAEMGRKGGVSVPAEKRTFSKNRAFAALCGRKGGLKKGANAAK